jgi:endonuclease/exonuclease/phosphatase (EEP) superfamily protein YafD
MGDTNDPQSTSRGRKNPRNSLYLLAALGIVSSLAPLLGGIFWAFELANFFSIHSALLLGVITVIFLWRHRRREAVITFCFCLLGLVFVMPLYAPSTPPAYCESTHQLVFMNPLKENQSYEKVRSYIRSLNPEIAIFQEVTPAWDVELEQLLASDYSIWIAEPSADHKGIGLLSRDPFLQADIEPIDEGSPPSVSAEYELKGEPVLLIGTHPGPPFGPVATEIKARHFEALIEIVRRHRGPVIVLGDLNMTERSSLFQRFQRETGLQDSRRGFGLQPTYPVGTLPFFMIPIDHALVSREFTVLERALGPDIGSDHYPVEIEVGIECE